MIPNRIAAPILFFLFLFLWGCGTGPQPVPAPPPPAVQPMPEVMEEWAPPEERGALETEEGEPLPEDQMLPTVE